MRVAATVVLLLLLTAVSVTMVRQNYERLAYTEFQTTSPIIDPRDLVTPNPVGAIFSGRSDWTSSKRLSWLPGPPAFNVEVWVLTQVSPEGATRSNVSFNGEPIDEIETPDPLNRSDIAKLLSAWRSDRSP